MNKVKSLLLLSLITLHFTAKAQTVVVNGYFNAADQRDEWIELLVTSDNTDMRNWSMRDNNSAQTSWQPAITFNNVAFWNNMRAGTVIMIWCRTIAVNGTTHPTDVNKNDGYIELSAQNTTYFGAGSFGTSPTFSGNSLNIAGTGDLIELLNGSGTHIHALGHRDPVGTSWTSMATPKLNHENDASSGEAIYVCPGATLADYNGPATGNDYTSKNNSTITFGLPNTCGASSTGNAGFWNLLRQPVIASQTITPTTSVPGDITFSWTAATDPNSSDVTTGYMILRNTTNTFTAPVDGTTYAVSSTLGSATVIAHINSSATVTYTDNTVTAGNCYYYRVYAFRYTTDNINGNSYNNSRGRAYNQTNFVFVNCLTVLPVELLDFSASAVENEVQLDWTTATESNNDFFTIERSSDALSFEKIISREGAGNSTQPIRYSATDHSPLKGTSYYRLKQTDFNGAFSYSNIESVTFNENAVKNLLYPNPASEELHIRMESTVTEKTELSILNAMGELVYKEERYQKEGESEITLNVNSLRKGIYLLQVKNGDNVSQSKFVKQ